MDFGSIAKMGQNMLKGGSADAKTKPETNALMSYIPKELLDKLPPAVRNIAASKAADEVAKQAPELLAKLKTGGKLTDGESGKLNGIVSGVFSKFGK